MPGTEQNKITEESWVVEYLDMYLIGACSPLSTEVSEPSSFNKQLISLNRLMYERFGNEDTLAVLQSCNKVYSMIYQLKSNWTNTGVLEECKGRLSSDPELLYFVCKVFEVTGGPIHLLRELDELRPTIPTTINPEHLLLSPERIILLHRILLDHHIIDPINTGDFLKCFDIANLPLVFIKPKDGMGATLVCVLSAIEGMKAAIANSNFNIKNYDNIKGKIRDADGGLKPAHIRIYDLVKKNLK